MKRIISFICVFILIFTFVGCGDESSQYSSKITTSNSLHSITFEIDENKINVSGTFKTEYHKYLLVLFNKDNNSENKIKVASHSFNETFILPNQKEVTLDLCGSKNEFDDFESIISNQINIEQVGDKWYFVKSPVLENNQTVFKQIKNSEDYLGATAQIQSDDNVIIELSKSITDGINDDYEKAMAIHDWVATNIYYDFDALSSEKDAETDAKNVLLSKKGIGEGYANVVAALLRSQNIPCRIQSGYVLDVDTNQVWNSNNISTTRKNHVWNEVYVNEKWIIIDTKFDSYNRFENGRYIIGKYITDMYFDTTLEFFSLSHKLVM